MSGFITLLGGVLTLYGLFLLMITNLNTGVLMTLCLGVFVLLCGINYARVKTFLKTRIGKVIAVIMVVLTVLEVLLVAFIAVYGQNDNVTYEEDAVIVLGAGLHGDQITWPLKLRLDKAVEYHHQNPDALIVVSGGQGFQETVSEADAMSLYLERRGVDKTCIIKEDCATSTAENMRFSKTILDGIFDQPYEVVVITNNFHVYRGVSVAKAEGFTTVNHLHAGLKWYNMMPCYLRESLAVLKLWLID